MEKRLSFVLKLSLKEIALRRVAIILWSESDILDLIAKFPFHLLDCQKQWRETVSRKVQDKLSELQLPESLSKQLMQILKPIGLEIMKWKLFNEDCVKNAGENFDASVFAKLCWTTAGTVDYRKTAKELIRANVLNLVERYKLACYNCLEDYIPVLWKELPADDKANFYFEKESSPIEEPQLELCWPYILEGKVFKLDYMIARVNAGRAKFHQHAFECSALNGNKTATEYFFHKMSREEREDSLTQTAMLIAAYRHGELCMHATDYSKEKFADVLFFLLSVMTFEQQIQIFQSFPVGFFRCFLDWPWQDFFWDTVNAIRTSVPEKDYDFLPEQMIRGIHNPGYYFPNLFQTIFIGSQVDSKKDFVDHECRKGDFFPNVFDIEDTETIEVIFRNIDVADRMRLVSSKNSFEVFFDYISRGGWKVVEVCLREATLAAKDKGRLKEAFMGYLREREGGQIEQGATEWRRFFGFLDERDEMALGEKRSKDETQAETKKLCCRE